MMKRFSFFLLTILTTILFTACDDQTESIGSSIIPENDKIEVDTLTLYAKSKSILANDSILANTSNVYLGRFTDPETGTMFSSSFITQFNCVENYGFPSNGVIGDTVVSIELKLFYNNFFGDSLNIMGCEVYELDKTLQEGTPYYTNIDPAEFYDESKGAIARKTYCATDYTVPDSIKDEDDYTSNITIKLPAEIGNRFIRKYYETDINGDSIGKINFSNSEEFINNVFKGLYVKTTQGDGTVMYITMARLNVTFNYYTRGSSGEMDSITTGIATFSSTKEVIQVNKFDNGDLKNLVEDNSCTYLKTPAGIFTEVELPVKEIIENTDTLNSVKIVFSRYNRNNTTNFGYSVPQTLLMVRKCDMYKFFLMNKVYDNNTSYACSFDSSTNRYTFSNIANLVNYCFNEYENGIAQDSDWENKNPDWNKVVLIPVSLTADSSTGSTIAISHNHNLTTARLQGGDTPIALTIVSSRYNK